METTTRQAKGWKGAFATIFAGQAFSILGSSAAHFAIIWWVTYQTESAVALTLATVAGYLPIALIGPFAGVWVDRVNRRTVMMLADGFVGLSSAALMLVFMTNASPSLWVLCAMLFARGCGTALHQPAMQAAIPQLVPEETLTKANGMASLISAGGNMLGPVIGAALMGVAPIHMIMLVDIAGAVFAILCLCFVKIPDVKQTSEKASVLGDMRMGLATARGNRPLMALALPLLITNLMTTPLGALFPLIIRAHFNGDAWDSSMGEVIFGVGMLLGSILLSAFGGKKRRFLLVSLAVLAVGLFAAGCGLLPSSAFVPFLAGAAVIGAMGACVNVPIMAYLQESTPPDQLGKVTSLLMAVSTLTMPFGIFVAGPLSEMIGVARWFVVSGGIIVAASVWFFAATKKYDVPAHTTT